MLAPGLMEQLRRNPGAGWSACGAGLWGGAAAGVLDGAFTLLGGHATLGALRALELLVAAVSLGAVAGGALGAGLAGLARAARWLREARAPWWWSGRAGLLGRALGGHPEAALAALVAAPLLVYDGIAMLSGRRAAALPARGLLAALFVVVAMAAIYVAVRACRALLGQGGRRRFGLMAALAAGAGVSLHHADRCLLPRLYPWFHGTLTLFTLLALVLAAWLARRAWGSRGARVGESRVFSGGPVLVVVLLVATAGGSLVRLRNSQVLRFVVHEQTRLTGAMLRMLSPNGPVRWENDDDDTSGEEVATLPAGPLRPGADIILITVDALRADHVHAYGYARPLTPAMDALARRSTRFARAYAQAPHTSFSIASLLTGTYHATVARLAPGRVDETIATVLRRQGFTTAAFYPPAVFFNDGPELKAYADRHYDFEHVTYDDADAERRVDQVIGFLAKARPERALVWAHLFEPHEPYESHPAFPFGGRDVDRYDSEIAQTDRAVGRLLDWLAKHRPNAVVVLTADHGEEFDEHGGRYHGSTLYDEQVRVPLLVQVPGVGPHVVSGPVQLVDVVPTLLGLLGFEASPGMRGTNLGPWLARPPAAEGSLPPAFAEVGDKRMIALGHEKLVCDLNWGYCALYDLARDPLETHNVADERAERLRILRAELDDWLDANVRRTSRLAGSEGGDDDHPVPRAIERARLGDLAAVPGLVSLLVPEVPAESRREAVRLLATLPARPATAAALREGRGDADPEVADWAAVALVRLGQLAGRARARAIAADPARPRHVRIHAALALAALGERETVAFLLEALSEESSPSLRRAIISRLGQLKDTRAVPALLALLEDVRHRAETVEALGEIGDGRACAPLIERLLADGYVPVRLQAALALAKLGDAVAIPALETAAREDSEPSVVEAAMIAVQALRPAL